MQPNNQNPYQQGQNPPPSNTPPQVTGYAGANVPEYLHLDPIQDPTEAINRRRARKKITLIAVVLTFLLIAGIAGTSWYIDQRKPESRLYNALENALSVKYVNKQITFNRNGTGTGTSVKADSNVDLSNPANILSESKIAFSRDIKRDGQVVTDKYSTKLVMHDKLYIYVDSNSGQTEFNGLKKNVWIEGDPVKGTINYRLEEFDVSSIVYSFQPTLVMGSYSESISRKTLDMVKASGAYKIIGTTSRSNNGVSLLGLKIKVDRNAINNLNKFIAEESNSRVSSHILNLVNGFNYEDMTLWLDEKDTIVETEYRNGSNEKSIMSTTKTVYTYPDKVTINGPNK